MATKPLARILLVEDDENVAFVTRETLAGSGAYLVERAASLAAARQLLRTQRFDLILMDYNLPDGTGLQLVQELGADVPVVMVTGRGDERVATIGACPADRRGRPITEPLGRRASRDLDHACAHRVKLAR